MVLAISNGSEYMTDRTYNCPPLCNKCQKCHRGECSKRDQSLATAHGSVQYIYRIDDGERWTRQPNGKYTMDKSRMFQKYEYTYEELMSRGLFTQNVKSAHGERTTNR